MKNSLLQSLKQLWHHLNKKRQRQFVLLLILMLISAFAEVISLGAILPFLGILISPDSVFNSPIGEYLVVILDITSPKELVLPLTIVFATAALIAGVIRILLLWVNTRLAYASGADLGVEVYRRTLYQPYSVHVARNTSEVISGISIKVNRVVFEVIQPVLILISSIVLLIAITLALIAINPVVAIAATTGFGTIYVLITLLTRQRLASNGKSIAYEQTQVVKSLQEGLGGIRDVLLDGTQEVYCNIYRQADHSLRRAQANNGFVSSSPRYGIEALGMVLIAFLAYGLSLQAGGISTALPVLGALALGAQRLLPALQLAYHSWACIAGGHASLIDALKLLEQPLPENIKQPTCAPLPFNDAITFDNLRFRYNSNEPWVLDGLNLKIIKGSRVGIVGSTGSGKSTLLDLLMGLLVPTEGQLLLDGQSINSELIFAWQRTIAHVPQNIYLADATLAENIAFGVAVENIDMQRVRNAARRAQIADFIESRPEGYKAAVGERGIRISGGQRQRIGIARALYKEASVLVFDEATSALDNTTEAEVMNAIKELNGNLTIILIAHRLSTVQDCDFIVELDHGKVVAQGKYNDLLECSSSFREMAKVMV